MTLLNLRVDALEQEHYEEFEEVTWKQSNSMRVPVILRVASSHIRITSVSTRPPRCLLSNPYTS